MPSEFGGVPVATPASGKSEFGGVPVAAPPQPAEPSGYGHELFRQLIADPVNALKSNPRGALTSALGTAFSVINPGFDPVPEGRHISLTQPTQGQAVQDIVNRGPGAVGAAATIGGLGLAAPFIPGSTVGTALRGGAVGGAQSIWPAVETSLLKYTGLPRVLRGVYEGSKDALAKRAAAAQPVASPNIRALLTAAQRAPAPESVLPESVASDLTRPSEVTPPAEATAQLNAQAAPAPAPVPIATRMAATARAARAGNADTLAQGLQDTGISADMADTIPRFKWRDIARAHGVDWPTSSEAQFNLIRDTRAALRQRTTK